MIGIVQCGSGNIRSVANAVDYLGGDFTLVESPADLDLCERIILPGVGSYSTVMGRIRQKGWEEALQRNAVEGRKPTLGICLGMQLMSTTGVEGGECAGLGWFDATVEKLTPTRPNERIPHLGWNQIEILRPHELLAGVPSDSDFYFVHSYAMRVKNSADVVARCDYADGVSAIVARDNIFATQFHPEKSQEHGLTILENFLDWNP